MQFKNRLLSALNTNLDPYKDIRIRGAWESDSEEDEYWDNDYDIGPNWLTLCRFFIAINNSEPLIYQSIDPNILDNWFHEFDRELALDHSQSFYADNEALGIDGYGNYLAHEYIYPDFEKDPSIFTARISPRETEPLISIQLGARVIQKKNWDNHTGYDYGYQDYQKNPLIFESEVHQNHIVLNIKSKYNSTFKVTAEIYKNALGQETIKLTTNLLIGTRPLETRDSRYFRSLEELQLRCVLASLFRHSELLHTWIDNRWPEPENIGFYYLSEKEQNSWVSRWYEFKNILGRNSAFTTSSGKEEFLNFMKTGEIPVIDAPRPFFAIKTRQSSHDKGALRGIRGSNNDGYPQIIQFGYVMPFDSHEKFVEQLSGSLHVIKTATDIVEDGFRNQRIMPTLDSDINIGFLDSFHHRTDGAALFNSIFKSESSVKGNDSLELYSYSRWIPQTLAEIGVEATRKNLVKGLRARKKWKRRRLIEWVVTDGVDPECVAVAITHLVEEFLLPNKNLKKTLDLLQIAIDLGVDSESERARSLQELITQDSNRS